MKLPQDYSPVLGIGNQDMARYLGISDPLVSMVNSGQRELTSLVVVKLSRLDRMLLAAQSKVVPDPDPVNLNVQDRQAIGRRVLACRNRKEAIAGQLDQAKLKFRQGNLMLKLVEAFRSREPVFYQEQEGLFLIWEREAGYKVRDYGLACQRILEKKIELLSMEEQAWHAVLSG